MAKDFTEKTFQKVIRGYDPEEVDKYIAHISKEYAILERQSRNNELLLASTLKKLDGTTRALREADRKADEALKNGEKAKIELETAQIRAEKEADLLLREAADAAHKIVSDAESRANLIRQSSQKMYDEVISFCDRLYGLYNTHIEAIEQIEASAADYKKHCANNFPFETENSRSNDISCANNVIDDETAEEYSEPELIFENRTPENTYAEADFSLAEDGAEGKYSHDDAETVMKGGDIYILPEDDGFEEYADESRDELAEKTDFNDAGSETRVLNLGNLLPHDEKKKNGKDNNSSDEKDFIDLDSLFESDGKMTVSDTDEFDLIFSGSDCQRNIDEIMRQPVITPQRPPKSKKHIL